MLFQGRNTDLTTIPELAADMGIHPPRIYDYVKDAELLVFPMRSKNPRVKKDIMGLPPSSVEMIRDKFKDYTPQPSRKRSGPKKKLSSSYANMIPSQDELMNMTADELEKTLEAAREYNKRIEIINKINNIRASLVAK